MSLTKDKNFMKQLDNDIEILSKSLYLDNPDLWFDFLDKSNSKNFDEMSLFFATKKDMLSIIRYSVEENKLDLNLPSKDKSFKSIKENLLDIASTESSCKILNYLSGEDNNTTINSDSIDLDIEYICPHCKANVFKSGYNVLISSTCTYSTSEKKIIRSNPTQLDTVICSNCNNNLKEVTPDNLENITNIETCIHCSSNIRKTGILKELSLNFNTDNTKFEESSYEYCCKSCRKSLEDKQLKYFNLV